MRMHRYPVFPSVKATVNADCYIAAAEALDGVPLVFLDGFTILRPEYETAAIDLLRSQFDAAIEYGCGHERKSLAQSRRL